MNHHADQFRIKVAESGDIPTILAFIHKLAEYERLSDQVKITENQLFETLFGPRPFAEVILAFEAGACVGFACFFHNYSTFKGRPGLYLEDIFVDPEHRGKGYGKQMLRYLANLAVERNCARMEWAVLNWNQPAIDVYRAIGAKPMDEWTVFRLQGDKLLDLAGK
ncbi:MAG TPA: GNAT family N-acetyltransferase [Bacteroidales bacterium]|nr:GNAT family N-acetyltransferase [Bacteroidales bacterium]HSA44276.1 GNAT family N-acetyltransferase [Bacteroidales bacterium]